MLKPFRFLKWVTEPLLYFLRNHRKLVGAVMIGFACGLGNVDKPPEFHEDPTEQQNDSDK